MGDSGSPQADSPTVTNPNEEEPDTPVDPEDPDDTGGEEGGEGGSGEPPLFPKDPVVRTEPAGTGAAPAGAERCDPLDPAYCLFPFPNNYFTTADTQNRHQDAREFECVGHAQKHCGQTD
jgi:hypothetical protein